MLDRCQSRRVASVPVGDNLQILMARKTEAPPYEDLINFPRAKDKDEIRCVMCGLPPGMACAIPRQNKDVCKVTPNSPLKKSTNLSLLTLPIVCFYRNAISPHGCIQSQMYILNGARAAKSFFGWAVFQKSLMQQSVIGAVNVVVSPIC